MILVQIRGRDSQSTIAAGFYLQLIASHLIIRNISLVSAGSYGCSRNTDPGLLVDRTVQQRGACVYNSSRRCVNAQAEGFRIQGGNLQRISQVPGSLQRGCRIIVNIKIQFSSRTDSGKRSAVTLGRACNVDGRSRTDFRCFNLRFDPCFTGFIGSTCRAHRGTDPVYRLLGIIGNRKSCYPVYADGYPGCVHILCSIGGCGNGQIISYICIFPYCYRSITVYIRIIEIEQQAPQAGNIQRLHNRFCRNSRGRFQGYTPCFAGIKHISIPGCQRCPQVLIPVRSSCLCRSHADISGNKYRSIDTVCMRLQNRRVLCIHGYGTSS